MKITNSDAKSFMNQIHKWNVTLMGVSAIWE